MSEGEDQTAQQEQEREEVQDKTAETAKESVAKTFSQDDLDRIVQDRVGRERGKFAGFDDLKAKAERLDEIEAAQKSDLEKAAGRAEKAERERDEARQVADSSNRRVAGVLRRSAIVAEAAKQGAIDADAVVALIPTDQVTVGEDDRVTGAAKAVKDLLAEKQYLAGKPADPGPSDGGPRNQPPADADVSPGMGRLMAAIPNN